jgi:hypothetical protein
MTGNSSRRKSVVIYRFVIELYHIGEGCFMHYFADVLHNNYLSSIMDEASFYYVSNPVYLSRTSNAV